MRRQKMSKKEVLCLCTGISVQFAIGVALTILVLQAWFPTALAGTAGFVAFALMFSAYPLYKKVGYP